MNKQIQSYSDTHRKLKVLSLIEKDSIKNILDRVIDYYIEKRRLRDRVKDLM